MAGHGGATLRPMDSQQPAAGVTVVPLGPDDRDRLLGVDAAAFFFDPSQHDVAHVLDYFEWPQTFGASRDGGSTLCGVYTAFSLGLTVPGPLDALTTVPMPGLSWVSVHPDHRRWATRPVGWRPGSCRWTPTRRGRASTGSTSRPRRRRSAR